MKALPQAWTDQLAEFHSQWEAEGHCPLTIRRADVALIGKGEAQTEARVRPIGILPYIYRVWMAIRKTHTRQWSLKIHGGQTHRGGGAGLRYQSRC